MSKLQDKEEYANFKRCIVFPIVKDRFDTRNEFGGKMSNSSVVYPICLEDIEDLKAGKFVNHNYIIPDCPTGTILVRHPFRPYELIPSDTKENIIIKDHLIDLAKIFKALGATDCKVKVIITKRETFKMRSDGQLKTPWFKVRGDFKETSGKSEESEYEMIIERKPGDNNGYELALRIAEKDGLLEVREIANILSYFNSEIEGRDKVYQLSEVLTEDYHKTLDAVIDINKSGAFTFKGKLNTDNACRRTIRIDKAIYFE